VSYQTAIVKVLGLTQIGYQNSHFHQSDDRSEKQLCRHAHLRYNQLDVSCRDAQRT
jgi:hypothetical protein